ncbi:hypothetical protein [Lysinibacillus fusiformis]
MGRYFIKWDGEDYTALYSGVLADEQYISKEIGTVNFKVADNVTNTSYKTKDGDAAFHEKGTRLFSIEGQEDLLAVKDESVVNGYRVYSAKEDTENKWDFNNLPLDKVQHIEIYLAYTQEGPKQLANLKDDEDIARFLELLYSSEENLAFQPNTTNGDPIYYEVVLYTGEPIAYQYGVQFDGTTYYWHPWETAIIAEDIKQFIPETPRY